MQKTTLYALGLIFAFGLFLRLFQLDKLPPSLNWDETAAAYNAWTIFHYGKDEWGNTLPLVFTSFRDDKHPVHIYMTAPFVGIFGLTDFNSRLPAALFSSICIILIFLIAYKLFKSELVGLTSALFLAGSPYHIHFSRGLWEIDFALFFFLLGITLFIYGLEKYKLLYFSFLAFGLSLYSYHSSKLVVIPLVFLLVILYFKDLLRVKKHFFFSLGIFGVFIIGIILEPRLLGLARIQQTSFSEKLIEDTEVFKSTKNERLASLEIALKNYPSYFSWEYLFEKGDQNPRNSVKQIGEFYKIDALFLLVGVLALIKLRSRATLFLFAWILIAPLPSALSSETPNATRALFMMGSMHLVSALGAATILNAVKLLNSVKLLKVKNISKLQTVAAVILLGLLSYEVANYLNLYFGSYAKKEAIEWQYGMKQIVEYVQRNEQYDKVYMTWVRQQPYIFFLYHLKVPVDSLLKTVRYEDTKASSFSTVAGFSRYQFGGWDTAEGIPDKHVLYIVSPSEYVGLRFREIFDVPLLVKYPDGADAFFLVTGR